jgi:hypothetical protein
VESQAAGGLQGDLRALKDGKPSGPPRDVLTGFLNDKGEAQGRPVGVRLDNQGALLVADDVGNTVWRVTPATKSRRGDVDPHGEERILRVSNHEALLSLAAILRDARDARSSG